MLPQRVGPRLLTQKGEKPPRNARRDYEQKREELIYKKGKQSKACHAADAAKREFELMGKRKGTHCCTLP